MGLISGIRKLLDYSPEDIIIKAEQQEHDYQIMRAEQEEIEQRMAEEARVRKENTLCAKFDLNSHRCMHCDKYAKQKELFFQKMNNLPFIHEIFTPQALEQRVMDLDPHMCKFPSVLPYGKWFTLYKGEAMQIRIIVTTDNVHRRFVVHIDMPNLAAMRTTIENIINNRLPAPYNLKVMSYLAPGRSLDSPLHANVNEGDFRTNLVDALHYVDKDSYDFGKSGDSTADMDAVISTIQRGRALEESVHTILLPLAKTLNDAYQESYSRVEECFKEFLEVKRTSDERYRRLIDEAVNKMEILSE